MQTSDYLTQLQQDKQNLVDNLTEKGITGLTGDETFTELVPEVLNIPSGGVEPSDYFNTINNSKSATTNYVGKWIYSIKKLYIPENTTISSQTFREFQGEEIENIGSARLQSGSSAIFMNCKNIKNLDLSNWDVTGQTSLSNMFWYCENLETVDVSTWNTLSNQDFSQIFNNCKKLATIDLSSWDFTNVLGTSNRNANNIFNDCFALENLTFGINYGKGFTSSTTDSSGTLVLSSCTKLTHDSLMNVINNLYDISSLGITVHLTIGATNIAKLTAEEIAIGTAKGWTIN